MEISEDEVYGEEARVSDKMINDQASWMNIWEYVKTIKTVKTDQKHLPTLSMVADVIFETFSQLPALLSLMALFTMDASKVNPPA